MEILGVGMSELIFIVIIALIVLGPKDMQKAGKTIGKWMRSIVTSDGWKIFQQTSRELRTLPNKLMRDANEELNQIGNQLGKDITGASTPTGSRIQNPNMPPLSKPFTPPSIPAKPVEKDITISTPEQTSSDEQPQGKENESGQQNDA
jgi:sec-independent protein translocase protein TatB